MVNLSVDLTDNATEAHEDATQSYQLFDRVSEGESEAQTRAVHTLPECHLQTWKSETKWVKLNWADLLIP